MYPNHVYLFIPSTNDTAENSGSISAEHGLGLMKAPYIRYSRDETAIDLMKKIKTLFDPKGLLNPGKYII
jgi:FAD/FMN-containing dehydrogenase